MGAFTMYLFISVLIPFSYALNPHLEVGQTTSESPNMEVNNQNVDHNHDVIKRPRFGELEQRERAPYFTNMKKMSKIYRKPAGNMIRLKCKAGGYPTPNVTWYKNNEVPKRHLGSIRYGQWSLTLEDLVTDDSGTYTCVVCNALGCIDFNYTVDVIEQIHNRPILTESPQNKTAVVGSNVNFSCKCISDLQPHIYWVNGIPGNGTLSFKSSVVVASQNPEILELHNVTYESEGWYTCMVANSIGVTGASAYLKVVDTLEEESTTIDLFWF